MSNGQLDEHNASVKSSMNNTVKTIEGSFVLAECRRHLFVCESYAGGLFLSS